MDDIVEITLSIVAALERLRIPYVIGGSLASSLHGIPRATQDVDIVAQLGSPNVPELARALRGQFYLDEDAMRDAVERRSSFNVIHLGNYFKADIFVARDDEASRLQASRAQRFELAVDPPRTIVVASPEDVVAQKLYWYRPGDEISERQRSDAIGVLKVAATRLDMAYLRRVAALLGVEGLLERAITEVGLSGSS